MSPIIEGDEHLQPALRYVLRLIALDGCISYRHGATITHMTRTIPPTRNAVYIWWAIWMMILFAASLFSTAPKLDSFGLDSGGRQATLLTFVFAFATGLWFVIGHAVVRRVLARQMRAA